MRQLSPFATAWPLAVRYRRPVDSGLGPSRPGSPTGPSSTGRGSGCRRDGGNQRYLESRPEPEDPSSDPHGSYRGWRRATCLLQLPGPGPALPSGRALLQDQRNRPPCVSAPPKWGMRRSDLTVIIHFARCGGPVCPAGPGVVIPCSKHRGNVKCHSLTIPEVAVGDDRRHRRLSRFRLRFASLYPLPRFDSSTGCKDAEAPAYSPCGSAGLPVGVVRCSLGAGSSADNPTKALGRVDSLTRGTHCARVNRSESA